MILSYKDYTITGTPQEIKEFIYIMETKTITLNNIEPNISPTDLEKDFNSVTTLNRLTGKGNGSITAEDAYNNYIKPILTENHVYKYDDRDDTEVEEELHNQEEELYATSSIDGQIKNSLRNKNRTR